MSFYKTLFIILYLFSESGGKKSKNLNQLCEKCINSGKEWCNLYETCDFTWCPIENSVLSELNCPKMERNVEYDDDLIRRKMLITTAAVNSDNPQTCFDNQMPTMKLYNIYNVENCTLMPPAVSCFASTSIDDAQKVIAISFRGTQNNLQLTEELLTYFFNSQQNFFDHGSIFSYFHESFQFLWSAGLKNDLKSLRKRYSKYELWVNGHSMGGALASIAASYIVVEKYWKPESIKLVTMGEPRVGDYEFALWHGKTFPYSFRIVHNRDIVPHIPPQLAIGYNLYHHRSEVWYPNDMGLDANFEICDTADGYYCSAKMDFNFTISDHGLYFVREMPAWGKMGCPNLWSP